MRILSATEAISPAIARTRLILVKPFRLGRSWKLSATAYVSTMGSLFIPLPLLGVFFIPLAAHTGPRWLVWAIGPGIALLLALMTFLFILCSRLQFPFMDIVMNRSTFIAPLWRQYGSQARRWTHAKVIIGTVAMFAIAAPMGLLGWWAIHRMNGMQALGNSQPSAPPFAFFGVMILIYSGFILVALAMSLLNDFMMPPLALEDASVRDAWQWVIQLVRAAPGQVILYAVLKVVLGFIGQMACVIVFEIVLIAVMLVVGLLAALFGAFLHAVHAPDLIFQVLGVGVIFLVEIGLIGYIAPFAYGLPMVFLEAYKLYFLGGRYPPLGDLLDRSTLPPEPPPPAPQFGYVPITPNTLL